MKRDGAVGGVEKGARTAGVAGKLGGEVAAEGVKTFGRAVGGLVQGGSEGAEERWNEGADKTRKVAREEAGNVRAEAKAPPCPPAPAPN